MSSKQEPAIGTVLGGFRLVERLAEGGMGVVYRAQNVRVDKMVRAVKVIRPELASRPEFHERFLREVEYMEVLRHDNILRVENISEDHGHLFMVMELLSGFTLEDLNKRAPGSLSISSIVDAMTQTLAGLAHAHKHNIIHRDLKPANLFLTKDGKVKILDFGIARHGDSTSKLTQTSQGIPGSPAYYAPEFSDGASATPQSDIYAMGITLYELLTGRVPFEGGGSSETQKMMSLLIMHSTKALPDPRAIRPDVPESFIPVLQKAASKKPQERFASAEDFAAAIKDAAHGNIAPARLEDLPLKAPTGALSTRFEMPQMGQGGGHSAADVNAFAMAADAKVAGSSGETRFAIPGVASATPRTPPPTALTNHPEGRGRKLAVPIAVVASLIFVIAMGFAIVSHRNSASEQEKKKKEQEAPVTAAQPREPSLTAPDGMSVIKGGTFKMGRASYNKPSAMDTPEHEVTVKDFAIERSEVTVGAYKNFVDSADVESPWPAKMKDVSKIANLPVVNVTSDDARAYCRWRYSDAKGRLPTEEEWEWAARAPDGRLYPWGNEFERTCVNGMKGEAGMLMSADRHTCGKSAAGLLDMAGNVWEWTSSKASAYSKDPSYPVPTQAEVRVIRGGSFFNTDADELTATVRRFAGGKNRFTGFRCAGDVKAR